MGDQATDALAEAGVSAPRPPPAPDSGLGTLFGFALGAAVVGTAVAVWRLNQPLSTAEMDRIAAHGTVKEKLGAGFTARPRGFGWKPTWSLAGDLELLRRAGYQVVEPVDGRSAIERRVGELAEAAHGHVRRLGQTVARWPALPQT